VCFANDVASLMMCAFGTLKGADVIFHLHFSSKGLKTARV